MSRGADSGSAWAWSRRPRASCANHPLPAVAGSDSQPGRTPMSQLLHFLARSEHPIGRAARRARRAVLHFTMPAPRAVVRPLLWTYLGLRFVGSFAKRVFLCEPFFKA